MIDRSIAPIIKPVSRIHIPPTERYTLNNGIPVIEINQGTQDIIRIDLLLDASRPVEDKQLAAKMTAALIKEGTQSHDALAIAEMMDYYGAHLSSGANLDYSYISIMVLNRFVERILPILSEILYSPSLTSEELQKHKDIQQQKLKSNLAKSDLVAYREVTAAIFGVNAIYGYNSTEQNITAIERADLLHHFKHYHTTDRCKIIVTGKVNKDIRSRLNQYIGQHISTSIDKKYEPNTVRTEGATIKIHSDQPHQTAIKLGRRMFTRKHPDFAASFMCNMALGGYFGSRLMESIREDLGYTYNIYSTIDPLIHDGYMTINTEVSNELVDPTITEIRNQIDRLQQAQITERELEMIRNYVMGNFLNMVDGPFRIGSLMKTLSLCDISIQEYEQLIQQIHDCTSQQIMEQAQKYLNLDDFVHVLVGNEQ